ncbi:MAG: ribonuclease HII [Candidatus Peribacteraceae bacterium]|nr:ribonuclease HII [Candidatus Peribacteraceae bacterium]
MSERQRTTIAGIDEAGRGALAGPVVAAACILPERKNLHPLIRDSKQLTPQDRLEAYAWICSCCQYGIGSSLASFIDSDGILAATEKAMQDAVAALATSVTPTYLLVDGRDKFWFDYPHSSIIRGDESEPCISAASILAKVTRDRMMEAYAAEFPAYGFDAHKGYGTAEHFLALRHHGECPLHRRSFLKSIAVKT